LAPLYLRLRRERVYGLVLQSPELLADLRWILLPAELFVRRPVIVLALQRAVLIHVDAPRHAVRGHHRTQHAEVRRRALLFDEVPARQELAGRVIHRRDEAQPRPAALQPVVAAPVPQEHEPGLGLAI